MATAIAPIEEIEVEGESNISYDSDLSIDNEFSADEAKILKQVLVHRHDYVHHPRLDEENIEAELFPPGFDDECAQRRRASGAIPTPRRFAKMTASQEEQAFLRYNYARRKVVELLAAQAGTATDSTGLTKDLVRWYRRVLALRADVVNANFPLVLAMAKNTRFTLLDVHELISEGNMAMLRSINKFDLIKGYRFSSYACRSILKAFSRLAVRSSRHRERYHTELDDTVETSDFRDNRLEENQQVFVEELERILSKNAAHLNETERMVIMERFALKSLGKPAEEAPKTLGEVGDMIGLTKERVRQIQNRAIEKLRIAMNNRMAVA